MLVKKKSIKLEELKAALNEQQKTGKMLGQVLVQMGFVTEKEMLRVLAEQQGMRFLDLRKVKIDGKVIKKVPLKLIRKYKIMPISIEGNTLTVAVSNPFDMWLVHDIETNLGYEVEEVLAASIDILEAIKRCYGVDETTIEHITDGASREVWKIGTIINAVKKKLKIKGRCPGKRRSPPGLRV